MSLADDITDTAEQAVRDVENGYASPDEVGARVLALPSMQAVAAVLRCLPDADWHALPADVQDWAFGGPVRR